MFSQIKTSKANKEIVTDLTRKLNLGAENVIARIAYTYSLSKNIKLEFKDLSDHGGKEYSKSVLFGENYDIYIGMLCTHYELYKQDNDIPKLIKLHLDHGIELINQEVGEVNNIDGFDFLVEKIDLSLN